MNFHEICIVVIQKFYRQRRAEATGPQGWQAREVRHAGLDHHNVDARRRRDDVHLRGQASGDTHRETHASQCTAIRFLLVFYIYTARSIPLSTIE